MAKRPRDPNQLAKLIVDIATGQVNDTVSEEKSDHIWDLEEIADLAK